MGMRSSVDLVVYLRAQRVRRASVVGQLRLEL
jgi:hypothetical protein